MPRRDFLGLAALGSAVISITVALIGIVRLPKAAVLPSPSSTFSVRLPDNLAPGVPFVPPGRPVALFRDAAGIFAISTICTHLGCIVKPVGGGFDCPCHGSRFDRQGDVLQGPAPSSLPWLRVAIDGDDVVVDIDETVPAGTRVTA
jgi:Rieske Fe-S protein